MIVQGLKLTLLGMGVVFSFLVLLLVLIYLSGILLRPYTRKESALIASDSGISGSRGQHLTDRSRKLTAIISAAVAMHKKRTGY